jgi:uncharacterized protein (TIGR02597 family)
MRASNNVGYGSLLSCSAIIFGLLAFLSAAGNDAIAGADACVGPSSNSVTINAPASSSTFFSIPFTRPPAFCGWVSVVATDTITVVDDLGAAPNLPALTPGPDSYYIVITSGAKEGAVYTTNGAVAMVSNTVTVSPTPGSCEDLTGVTGGGAGVGDRIAIIPYWTIATVWPGSPPVVITAGSDPSAATNILLWNPATQSFRVYYYKTSGLGGTGWRSSTSTSIDASNQRFQPNETIGIVQHAGGPDLSFTVAGYEVKHTTRACLIKDPLGSVGFNFVSNSHYYSPGSGQTLDASGLASSLVASDLSASPPQINDQLLVYDSANSTPSHIYIYQAGHWADLNNPPYTVDRGASRVFEAGTGIVIVRVPSGPSPLIWVDPL